MYILSLRHQKPNSAQSWRFPLFYKLKCLGNLPGRGAQDGGNTALSAAPESHRVVWTYLSPLRNLPGSRKTTVWGCRDMFAERSERMGPGSKRTMAHAERKGTIRTETLNPCKFESSMLLFLILLSSQRGKGLDENMLCTLSYNSLHKMIQKYTDVLPSSLDREIPDGFFSDEAVSSTSCSTGVNRI